MAQNLARKTCGRVKNLFSEWEISREACPITDLDSAWGKLLEEATQLHGNTTNVQSQIAENKQIIDLFLTSETELDISHLSALSDLSHSQIKDKEDVLNGIEKGLQTAKGALAQVKQNHESHRSDMPEIGEEDTLENIVIQIDAIKETLMVLARQMGEVDSQIKANDSRREDYNRQKAAFEQAEKEWLKWDSLCKIFGDKEGKTFRVIAQSYVLRELLAHANTFLRNFSDRYELVCQNSLTILSATCIMAAWRVLSTWFRAARVSSFRWPWLWAFPRSTATVSPPTSSSSTRALALWTRRFWKW